MLSLDHPLWQAAHRPLFFCAGLAALVAPAVWLWPVGLVADPLHWHLHELLFGMGGAAVGGYLLTAAPSWTGAGRVGPQSVRALTLLWLLARLALPLAESLPFGLILTMALAYFAAL
ncbi:MAG TPA: NnrS family protein, partial [Tabrizicola sp.]|nr:NnrS family protein [Tabrizicola sp.]